MKKHFHTYKKILFILPLLLLGVYTSVQAQDVFEFKIQYLAESNDSTWGVYVRPTSGFAPGNNDARTGSGQVTILMKDDGQDSIYNIQSVSGTWNTNYDIVRSPCEAPGISYLFVGMNDGDGILYENGEETLLFTFQVAAGCPDTLGLIDTGDPFLPEVSTLGACGSGGNNSVGNNPGQDLAVYNSSTDGLHNWVGNYGAFSYSCGDCDDDGVVDGIEDTNGDGMFTPGIDSSAICDVCDPNGINNYSATISGENDTLMMCGAVGEDSVALVVTMTGGWSPFTVVYEGWDGTNTFRDSVTNYVSGDPIYVSPDTTTNFRVVTIKDTPPNMDSVLYCEIHPDSLFDTVTVVIEGPLTIDASGGDPVSVTVCNLDTIGFKVNASNGGAGIIEYQWQLSSDSTNWSDVVDGTPYAFATTDSLVISNPLGLNGMYYRAKVFTTSCDTIYSAGARLGVDGPFIIDFQPEDKSVCAKEDPIYFNTETSIGQGVFTRTWQVSTDTGATWTDVNLGDPIYSANSTTTSGGTGIQSIYYDTLFIDTASYDMDGYLYRIEAVGQNTSICNEIHSDEAKLTVEGRLSIATGFQPVDVSICSDTVACFGVTAQNESSTGTIEYQWFVKERGASTWTAIVNDGTYSGARSDTLCVTNVVGRDSFSYRVEIQSSLCEIVTSDSAMLRVDGPVSFQTESQDAMVCAAEDATYFATETFIGQGILDRRWQFSTDNGSTWNDVVIAGLYSASSDSLDNPAADFEKAYYDTLFLDTASYTMDQWQYRVAALGQNSNNCIDIYSAPATLTVEGKISIVPGFQPVDVSICSDTAACFGVTVTNEAAGTIEYQWYSRAKGSTSWTALSNDGTYSGARSDTLCVTNVLGRDSFLYRVDIQTTGCSIVTSDSALLRVDGPIVFSGDQIQDVTVCAGEDPNYFAAESSIGQGQLATRWQVSTDDGASWTDVNLGDAIYTASQEVTAGGINIDSIYYDTLFIDTATFDMNGWQYRIAAIGLNSSNCEDIFTREATLTVEGRLSVTVQPEDVEICSDSTACFGVSIDNESLEGNIEYQWYVKERTPGSTWQALSSSDGSYGGVRSDTLCVNFITGRDSFLYRVGIRTNLCSEVLSDSAILRVDGPIEFIVNPQDETICAEEDPVYFTSVSTIGQGIMNTRWQISTDDGANWADINDPGLYRTSNRVEENGSFLIDSTYYDTLFIDVPVFSMNGWRYRTVASGEIGSGCNDVESGDAILNVEGKISVTAGFQPVDVSICSDTTACFGVRVDNESGLGNVQFQWQVKPVGQTAWINLSSNTGLYGGVNSDTMCVNSVQGLDSFLYRVQIFTSTCNIVNSDSAMLSVSGPVDVATELQDVSICAAEDATFFAAETTIGQGGLTNRWQVSTDSGATWNDVLLTDPIYSTNSTKVFSPLSSIDSIYYDTLFISGATVAGMDGWQYRIVANGLNGTSCQDIASDEATLTVHGPLSVTSHPANDTICSGKPALFHAGISNSASGDIDFQWQASTDGIIWNDIPNNNSVYNGIRDSVLSISDVARVVDTDRDSIFYRALFFTNYCAVDSTNAAQLRVEGPFTFGTPDTPDPNTHPHDTIVCTDEPIIFTANPTNNGFGEMTFQWKVLTVAGGNWANIQDIPLNGSMSGENTNQLTINPMGNVDRVLLDSALFRLDITSGVCADEISSESALLRIDGPLTFDIQPRDTTNCADKGVIFFINVTNAGYGGDQTVQYRWQEYDHETMAWSNIENAGVYNGANSDTLSIDITTGLDSNQYRAIVWTSVCNSDTSDVAYLIEEGSVSFEDHPEDVIICSGEATSFTARMENSTGQGTNVLNWQISTNNGISWTNIDTSQIKDGNKLFVTAHTNPALTPAAGDSTVTEMSTTLDISDVEGMQGYRFRAASTSTYCDTVFSQLAKLTVEGPFIATLSGDNDICANIGTTITADVTNQGAGLPTLRWQYKGPDSTDFADIPTSWGIFHGEESNGIGTKVLTIDSVLNQNSRSNLATVDTFWSLHNYEFRLSIVSDTCEVAVFSDTFTLRVVADTIGRCDWDLDGLDNTTDLDDDNDGLTDSIELYITTGPGSEPQDSVAQFDTDTDNDSVADNEEDADEDTISNGEEVDDDDGDGLADGVNTSTGGFDGFPASPNPLYEDDDDVFNGDPLDPCDPILSPSCIGVVLDINVKLQGAMPGLGSDNTDAVLMRDDLRSKGLLPKDSPYEDFFVLDSLNTLVPAFEHVKRDMIDDEVAAGADSTAVFGVNGRYGSDPDNAIVDWVFIEVRSGLKLDSVVTTRAALLQRDGDVRDHRVATDPRRMDSDGYAYVSFDSTLAGEYYVVVRHRNHLGVMTNEAGLYSPIVTRVDFTDPDFNALGIHPMRMNRDSTEQYMWAGDVTSDRKIIYQGPGNDVDEMFFRVIAEPNNVDLLDNYIVPGYYRTDYNLDGRTIFQGPDNDREKLIFRSILAFPDNKTKFLANYVILEQLP